jgi:hypothetical protein
MAKPSAATAPSDKLALYEKLVATNPDVERKGATVPYTSVNGHMSSYLSKEGEVCGGSRFVTRLHTRIETVLRRSYRYVSSLKPKATTRKKKA